MPYCAILECKNDSRTKNVTHGGISYHRFPKDPVVKEQWIKVTGRVHWMPTKSSTICSEHFTENDFRIGARGQRYLFTTAVPTIKIVIFYDDQQNVDAATPGLSKMLESCFCEESLPVLPDNKARLDEVCVPVINVSSNCKQYQDAQSTDKFTSNSTVCSQLITEVGEASSSSAYSSPRNRQLESQLRWSQEKNKKQNLKIKRLQTQNRRLKKKITNIEEILKSLEQMLMAKENQDSL